MAAVASPLVLTSRSFGTDFSDHTWLVLQQTLDLRDIGHPSYFVQSDLGAFFPWYAFYGGSLYALMGVVARVLGDDAVTAVVLAVLGAFAMAQLGWSWFARELGLRGWRAHAPGALYVTSAYYVTNVYGRGDVPELVATSSLPLLVASAVHLARAPRLRAGPVAAFLLAAVLATGSHTITLLWGALFLVAVGLIALVVHGRPGPALRRGAARVGALLALAVAVNAWFLVPLLLYRSRILISVQGPKFASTQYSTIDHLLRPWRESPQIQDVDVDAQLPILALLWCAALAWTVRHRTGRVLRRWAAGLTVVLAGLVLVMAFPTPLGYLPSALKYIQFPYRFETYALFCICGLVALGLLRLREAPGPRWAPIGLAVALAVNLGLAVQQGFAARSYLRDRDAAVASADRPPKRTWYIGPDYADGSAPVVRPSLPGELRVRTAGPRRERYRAALPAGVRTPGTIATNVSTGPYLVAVAGATPAGRLDDGSMVVRVDPARSRTVTFTGRRTAALRAGQAISLAAIALAVLTVLLLAIRRRRDGRR